MSRLTGCGAIWSLNLKRKSEEEVANKRNVSKSLVVVCLDPRLSSIDSIPPLLCASVAPFIDCARPSLSNALLIFAVDIRAGVTQQLQEQVYVAQTVSMMHIKTRIWQVCKQLPPPERRQVLINGGPGRDHELGISPPPMFYVQCMPLIHAWHKIP